MRWRSGRRGAMRGAADVGRMEAQRLSGSMTEEKTV